MTQRIGENRVKDLAISSDKISSVANTKITGLITSAQIANIANTQITGTVINSFSSGTKMLFVQTTAPTGWTKDTTHDNKALRVVTGSAGSGGTSSFTTVFTSRTPTGNVGDTTLTAAQSGLPAHNHDITDPGHAHTQTTSTTDGATTRADASSGGTVYNNVANINSNTTGITINNNGAANASEAHNHTWTGTAMDFSVQYVDTIIATKD